MKSNLPRECDVDLLAFRRALVLQLLNCYHTISAVTALQAAAQIEVACSILCVLRDEHLSINLSVNFSAGLLALQVTIKTNLLAELKHQAPN